MFSRIQYNFEKNRQIRDFVDLNKYTSMELEHGMHTANIIPMSQYANLGHFDPNSVKQNNHRDFQKEINE